MSTLGLYQEEMSGEIFVDGTWVQGKPVLDIWSKLPSKTKEIVQVRLGAAKTLRNDKEP